MFLSIDLPERAGVFSLMQFYNKNGSRVQPLPSE